MGLNPKGPYLSLEKKRKFLCWVHQLHKAGPWNYEVSSRRLATTAKKCTKSVMHVQSCCFANVNRLLFCRSRCRRRRCCLSAPLLWSRMLLPCCSFHTPNLKSNFMIFWREFLILKEKLHLPIIFAPSGRMMRRRRGTRTSPVESLVSWLSYR